MAWSSKVPIWTLLVHDKDAWLLPCRLETSVQLPTQLVPPTFHWTTTFIEMCDNDPWNGIFPFIQTKQLISKPKLLGMFWPQFSSNTNLYASRWNITIYQLPRYSSFHLFVCKVNMYSLSLSTTLILKRHFMSMLGQTLLDFCNKTHISKIWYFSCVLIYV